MLEAAERAGGAAPGARLVHGRRRPDDSRAVPFAATSPPAPSRPTAGASSPPKQVVTGSRLPWTIVRPPMVYGPRDQEVLKVFRLARLGLAPVLGDGTQELSAVHGADLADALSPPARAPRPCGGRTTPAIPKCSPAPRWPAPSAARWAGRPAVIRVPAAIGRGVLRRDRGRRAARRPDHHPHRRQGQRVLPAGLDRRPRAPDAGHRLARRSEPRTGLAETYEWYRTRRMAVAVQPALPMALPPRRPQLLPVDIVLLGYLAVVSAVAIHRAGAQPACWWLVAGERA